MRVEVYKRGSSLLHVTALASMSLGQPLLGLMARYPEFLVAHGVSRQLLFYLVAALLCAAPVALWIGPFVLSWASLRLARATHLIAMFALASLMSMQVLSGIGSPVLFSIASAMLAIAVTVVYARFELVRSVLSLMAVSPVIFALLFFANPQVRKIAFGTAPGGEAVPIGSPVPIVLVVFDELSLTSLLDRERRIDARRYPNLAALASQSNWYPNATTISDSTAIAVPAIVDGLYPVLGTKRLPIRSDHPNNLFRLLEHNYSLRIHENMTALWQDPTPGLRQLRPLLTDLAVIYAHTLLPPELATRHLPGVGQSWKGFAAVRDARGTNDARKTPELTPDFTRRDRDFGEFIAEFQDAELPALFFLHSLLPHAAWDYLPSGVRYTVAKPPGGVRGLIGRNNQGINANTWVDDDWVVTQAHQRHLLQVGFVDHLVGEMIVELRRTGLYDEALVIIAADHGIGFTAGRGRRAIAESTLDEVMPVLLLIKLPKQTDGFVDRRHVQIVDIFPTIVDVIDAEIDWKMDGKSLLDPTEPLRTELVVFHGQTTKLTPRPGDIDLGRLVERQHQRFGAGSFDEILRHGLRSELLDRPLAEFARGIDSAIAYRLSGAPLYDDVDLSSRHVPLEVSGILLGAEGEAPHEVVVAVNGVIRSATQSAVLRGAEEFTTLVPKSALRNGANEVEVFLVSGTASDPLLHRVTAHVDRADRRYSLRRDKGREFIVDSNGASAIVGDREMQGFVSSRFQDGGTTIHISGLAADFKDGEPARRIVVFADGEFVFAEKPLLPRPELAEKHDLPSLLNSGYSIKLPAKRFDDVAKTDVRVIAISKRGTAVETVYPSNEKWLFRDK